MFQEFFTKLDTFAHHHQAAFAGLITFCIVCISWGIDNLLETYLFPDKPLHGYLFAIGGGVLILWIIQHYILHAA